MANSTGELSRSSRASESRGSVSRNSAESRRRSYGEPDPKIVHRRRARTSPSLHSDGVRASRNNRFYCLRAFRHRFRCLPVVKRFQERLHYWLKAHTSHLILAERDVGHGSESKILNLSRSRLLHPSNRTSMRTRPHACLVP